MRIGVAIALYNGKTFLKEQLDSLLAQTMMPDRVVCCDDGNDGSLAWIAEYAHEHGVAERFLLVQNNVRLGYVQNFYKALDLCDADLLFLCDQDDIWDPKKIERMQMEFLADPSLMLLSCAHTLIDSQGKQKYSIRYSHKSGSNSLIPVSESEVVTLFQWPGMTMALRRQFWDQVREIAISISAPHDRVLGLLAASRKAMSYLDIPLCCHRLHSANNGGDEDSPGTFLLREFKQKELETNLQWIDAQLAHESCFSKAACEALHGYREFIALRLQAIKERSILLLCKTLRCGRYIHFRGLLADFMTIVLHK